MEKRSAESELQVAESEMSHSAIKYLTCLAADVIGRIIRQQELSTQFFSRLFAVLMRMLLDVEEDEDFRLGKECLARLANALGGDTIFPVASHHLPAYLAAPETDWQKHHAALVALAQISRGCSKVMITNSEQVVNMVLNSFYDHPHPRVRCAAITAIARLSIHLKSCLQIHYHTRVLPALASAIHDFNNPRLQAHAAFALIDFSNNCSPDILTLYLDGIVTKLCLLLQQSANERVQEAALTALASLADNSTLEQFRNYHDQVMPCLKAILVSKNEKASRMLRVKAKRCIGHFAEAVGKDKFPKQVDSSFNDVHMTYTKTNAVYQELLVVLGGYYTGLSVSGLPLLQTSYSAQFHRSLDYKSLGVSSIEELLVKMGDRVQWREVRESKVKYAMSASVVEIRRRLYLKPDVQTLLNSHRGEIEFGIFEKVYADQFKRRLQYGLYGLTDLDHLCEALIDILEVELDGSGEKVIKAVKRYNLRKRKCQLSEPGLRPKKIAPSECK